MEHFLLSLSSERSLAMLFRCVRSRILRLGNVFLLLLLARVEGVADSYDSSILIRTFDMVNLVFTCSVLLTIHGFS